MALLTNKYKDFSYPYEEGLPFNIRRVSPYYLSRTKAYSYHGDYANYGGLMDRMCQAAAEKGGTIGGFLCWTATHVSPVFLAGRVAEAYFEKTNLVPIRQYTPSEVDAGVLEAHVSVLNSAGIYNKAVNLSDLVEEKRTKGKLFGYKSLGVKRSDKDKAILEIGTYVANAPSDIIKKEEASKRAREALQRKKEEEEARRAKIAKVAIFSAVGLSGLIVLGLIYREGRERRMEAGKFARPVPPPVSPVFLTR